MPRPFRFRHRPPKVDPRASKEGAFLLDVVKRRNRLKDELRVAADPARVTQIRRELAAMPFGEE